MSTDNHKTMYLYYTCFHPKIKYTQNLTNRNKNIAFTDHLGHFLQHAVSAGLLDAVLPLHSPLDEEAQGVALWQPHAYPLQRRQQGQHLVQGGLLGAATVRAEPGPAALQLVPCCHTVAVEEFSTQFALHHGARRRRLADAGGVGAAEVAAVGEELGFVGGPQNQ